MQTLSLGLNSSSASQSELISTHVEPSQVNPAAQAGEHVVVDGAGIFLAVSPPQAIIVRALAANTSFQNLMQTSSSIRVRSFIDPRSKRFN